MLTLILKLRYICKPTDFQLNPHFFIFLSIFLWFTYKLIFVRNSLRNSVVINFTETKFKAHVETTTFRPISMIVLFHVFLFVLSCRYTIIFVFFFYSTVLFCLFCMPAVQSQKKNRIKDGTMCSNINRTDLLSFACTVYELIFFEEIFSFDGLLKQQKMGKEIFFHFRNLQSKQISRHFCTNHKL